MRLVLPVVGCVVLSSAQAAAAPCESLTGLKLAATAISAAQVVAPGAFLPPAGAPNAGATYRNLPEFCRVQGVIQPSPDSHIEFEVWLPLAGWNRKYEGAGNGGFAGSINYAALAGAVASGYAGSSTDTGHEGAATDATWALAHPEKRLDFGYRAIHETAEKSKAVIRAFYGVDPQHSYFSGCSNGGRQALVEAQRYPEDYDGIVAGAPANFWTHLLLPWDVVALEAAPASYIPATKLPAIEAATLAACDAMDGVKDGVIDNPTRCHFDPSALLCKGSSSDRCLTPSQVAALKKIYSGARTSKGQQIFPGYMPGGETGPGGWAAWITGSEPGKGLGYRFSTQFFTNMLYETANWDYRTFNFDRDVKFVDDKAGPIYNATNSDLKRFKTHGGKLILYHGWSDAAIPPTNTVKYYQSILSKMGQQDAGGFTRLYMVPGMQHCTNGPGPSRFDALSALEQWVEQGKPPEEIVAAHVTNGVVDRTRPLCAYPQEAHYKGTGSTDEAANFMCALPTTP